MLKVSTTLKPFTKWAGGKRQLLPEIFRLLPVTYNRYYEPFVGGGALFFALVPQKATINDLNADLICTYKKIRDDVDKLVELLKFHAQNNSKEYYLQLREVDRNGEIKKMTDTERAARLLYMLRVDFNGLYRVNRKNQFNVPYGRYKTPKIINETLLKSISNYFNENDILIEQGDFRETVKTTQAGDFVYFDPPYMPLSSTSSFTSYTQNGFNFSMQTRLRDLFYKLTSRGVKIMLSNSATDEIYDLYAGLDNINITIVKANRMINANSSNRKKIDELIIRNYR